MKIEKENSLLLIIDIQEKLFPFIYNNEELKIKTSKLIQGIKTLGINILVTEQYTKGLGFTINPLKGLLQDIHPFEKLSFSCCRENNFLTALENANKKFIIIAGIEAHVCVLQTTLDLLSSGYIPVIVEDCISSRNVNDKIITVERMRSEGTIITTYESILFELLKKAGTPQFKEISKIVK